MKLPKIRRMWVECPHCGSHDRIFDNTANCNGVFSKCKSCKKEFEIKIKDGKQII